MESQNAIDKLSSLAHAGRLSVFRLLVKAAPDGLAAGDIARHLNIPPNTLSAQLLLLSHAGLIQSRREGRSIIYSADTAAMTDLILYLMQDCCSGHPEICEPVVHAVNSASCC